MDEAYDLAEGEMVIRVAPRATREYGHQIRAVRSEAFPDRGALCRRAVGIVGRPGAEGDGASPSMSTALPRGGWALGT